MAAKPYECTEHHWVVRFKWQNCTVFELYLSKVVTKRKKTITLPGKERQGGRGKGEDRLLFLSPEADGWGCHAWRHVTIITRGGTAVAENAERWNNRGHLMLSFKVQLTNSAAVPPLGFLTQHYAFEIYLGRCPYQYCVPCFIDVYLLLYGCTYFACTVSCWGTHGLCPVFGKYGWSCYKTPCFIRNF